MKINRLKKMVLIILSVVMVLGMSIGTMAATMGGGTKGSATPSDSTDVTLTIPKKITMFNTTSGEYNGPDITYTYTIAPATVADGTTVGSAGLVVKAGPADGATLSKNSVVYSSDDKYAMDSEKTSTSLHSSLQTDNAIVVTVDLSKFTAPGVYRYTITDTTSTGDLYNAGIARVDSTESVKYLDIEILNNEEYTSTNGKTPLRVGSYTLMNSNLTATPTNDEDLAALKSDGFVGDLYRTFNMRIEKSVEGNMGDKTHQFPFNAYVTNHNSTSTTQLTYQSGKQGQGASVPTMTDTTEENLSFTLADGEYYYIRGLSPFALVNYMETNDTTTKYKVTIEGRDNDSGTTFTKLNEVASLDKDGTIYAGVNTGGAAEAKPLSNYTSVNSTTDVSNEYDIAQNNIRWVKVTNEATSISPTGIVRRYLPYMAIAVVAVLLMVGVIASRRRDEDLEEE